MASVLRRFGLKKGDQREGRQAAPKDLFAYSERVQYGFPYKPSSIAFHPQLRLLALGTQNGSLRIFGAPGVQLISVHRDEVAVLKIFFSGQRNIITLCADNSLHLWEIGMKDQQSYLQEIRSLSLDRVINGASSTCLSLPAGRLFLGTDSGHVYMLDLKNFKLLDHVIFQENVVQNAPEEFRRNPGAVESITVHPLKPDKVLIGYNRGLIVLYNLKQKKAEQFYNAGQELECLSFHRNGKEFMSTHINGSYIVWKTSEANRPKEQTTTPYGPFPCKTINKLEWKTVESDDMMMIFSGGMPRASYGDHHTVTIMQGEKHVVFDFTSKVIDFVTFSAADEILYTNNSARVSYDDPSCLFVLLEEEMIVIDLESEGWPVFIAPYLATVHSTAITCTAYVSDVSGTFWNKIMEAGQRQSTGFSCREWPVCGGVNLCKESSIRDILITGHEDGSVRFWDVSSVDIVLLYKLSTSNLFSLSTEHENQDDLDMDEEWPPFRKVGTYDPFSDDPRLGIQKIGVSALSATLVLGGTAGQVIVMRLGSEECQMNLRCVDINIVGERDNFVWKGHEALPLKTGARFPPGFQPLGIMQIYPPAACTSLSFHSEWQIVAVGTSHGFGLADYNQMVCIACKCTLSLSETSGVGESTMSRRKSFKKSLRESFRRLRSRRSERHRQKAEAKEDEGKMRPITSPGNRNPNGASTSRHRQTHVGTTDVDLSKPIERQVEARPADDVSGSIVRALYFVETYLSSAQVHTPTFWAGTNAGYVYLYQLTIPPNERRSSQGIQSLLVKEIHLKHRAPVMSICVLDHRAIPFITPREARADRTPEAELTGGSHSVVICSEEQLKVFSLPNLSAREKYKLTASEGSKIRKVSYVNFRSPTASNYFEYDLVCLTNLGEVQIFSLPHLRRIFNAECIRKENIIGVVSCVFNRNGEAFHLSSPSEFMRFSVSTAASVYPVCSIQTDGRGDDGSSTYTPSPERNHAANASRTRAAISQVSGDHLGDDNTELHGSPNDDSIRSGEITEDSVRVHISGGSEERSFSQSPAGSSGVVRTRTNVTQNASSDTVVSARFHGTSSIRN